MLNKIFKLFATLSIVGVVAFGVGCSNYDNDIDNLQKQIDELKGNGEALSTALDNLKAVAATQAELAAQADALREALAQQKEDFEGLLADLSGAQDALKSELEALQSSAATKSELDQKLAALETKFEGLLGNYYDKSEIEDKLDAVKALLNGYYSKGEIDSKLAEFVKSDDFTKAIDEVKASIDKTCADLADKIEGVDARLTKAEAALAELDGFAEFWYGTEENEWNGFYKDLQTYMENNTLTDDEINALFSAIEERVNKLDDDNVFLMGYEDEDGIYHNGWVQDMQNWRQDLNQLDGKFLETLTEMLAELATSVGDIEAALDGLVTYDEFSSTVEGINKAIANLINLKIGADTELGKFYNNYTKLQKLFIGQEESWEARAKWLEATGNASYAAYIEQLYSDIDELVSGKKTLAEGINNLFVAINNTIEAALQSNGSIATAIEEALGDFNTDTLEPLIARISALETTQAEQKAKIAALIDRIQSVVYVPVHADKQIHLGGTYIAAADASVEDRINLSTSSAGEVIKYRISPAGILKDLVEGGVDFYFYSNPVTRAITQNPDFSIVNLTPDYVDGTVTFNVKSNFVFTDENGLAVALRISSPKAEDSDAYADEVYTEITSEYTVATTTSTNVLSRFQYAHKNGTLMPLAEETGDAEEGDGEGETETPELPNIDNIGDGVVPGEAQDAGYTVIKVSNAAKTASTFEGIDGSYVSKLQYSQDKGETVTFFEDCEVVYVDADGSIYTLAEAAEKFEWEVDIDWGIEHANSTLDSYTRDYPYPFNLVEGTYTISEEPDANNHYTFTLDEVADNNVLKGGYAVDLAFAYITVGEEQFYVGGSNIENHLFFNHKVEIVKDQIDVTLDATLVWNYTKWDKVQAYDLIATLDKDLTEGQLAELGTFVWNWDDENSNFVGTDNIDYANAEKTITLTAGATKALEADDVAEGADYEGYAEGDQLYTFTLEGYSYNHGAASFTVTGKSEGTLADINVTLNIKLDSPGDKTIDVAEDELEIGALNTDYVLYAAYSGEDYPEIYPAEKNPNFFSAEELVKYFDNNADNARRIVRQSFQTALVANYEAAEDVEAAAALYGYNTNPASNGWKNSFVPAEGEIADYAHNTEIFTIKFTELNFDNAESLELTLPETAKTATSSTGKWNGPIFTITGDITVKAPEGIDFTQGDRLSGELGLEKELRPNDDDNRFEGPNNVYIKGQHVGDKHDYQYEVADILKALYVEDTENYWVDFEVFGADIDGEFVAAEDWDETTYGALPTIKVDTEEFSFAKVKWDDLTYHNDAPAVLYNSVKIKAYLKSKSGDLDNDITIKTRVITLYAETPFNPAEADNTKMYEVPINQGLTFNVATLLSMKNLVGDDKELFEDGAFLTDYTNAECYGLEITWAETCDVVLSGETGDFKLVYTMDSEGNFEIPVNDAKLAHSFDVTAHFTITGNFGFVQEGTVTFNVY